MRTGSPVNFILVMLSTLTFVVAVLIVKTCLQFKVLEIEMDYLKGQEASLQQIKNLLFVVYSLEYVALIPNNLVLWLFAMKYWVVAKKVEMFQADIRLET